MSKSEEQIEAIQYAIDAAKRRLQTLVLAHATVSLDIKRQKEADRLIDFITLGERIVREAK